MDLKWEEPARTSIQRGKRTNWQEIALALQDNPGSWAMIIEKPSNPDASATASRMRRGFYTAFTPIDQYEVISNGTRVYARWIGMKP